MRALAFGFFCLAAPASFFAALDNVFERVDDTLTVATSDSRLRARLSGTFDLEAYDFQQPAPGFIHATGNDLLVPRLSLFLDAVAGERIYVFAQSRLDTGFDPGNEKTDLRLDEYAIRFTPGSRAFSLQAGKFATVFGNWIARHGSWANPFINAPLAYDQLTGVWDSQAAKATGQILSWSHINPPPPQLDSYHEKYIRVPIIWGPSYTSGLSASGEMGRLEYAAEFKNAALSSRPDTWQPSATQWRHPTLTAHVEYRLNEMWSLGSSASTGTYLRDSAGPTVPVGGMLENYRQTVLGQDVSFAWHHFQFWAEAFEARFQIPNVGGADVLSYYAEAKYKFAPQFSGALRWNQQVYGNLPQAGREVPWARDVWRIDVAPEYRLTAHVQMKLQYSLEYGDIGARGYNNSAAAQLTMRF